MWAACSMENTFPLSRYNYIFYIFCYCCSQKQHFDCAVTYLFWSVISLHQLQLVLSSEISVTETITETEIIDPALMETETMVSASIATDPLLYAKCGLDRESICACCRFCSSLAMLAVSSYHCCEFNSRLSKFNKVIVLMEFFSFRRLIMSLKEL